MDCEFCRTPATVHLTEAAKAGRREVHLCGECAAGRGLFAGPDGALDIEAVLRSLLGSVAAEPGLRCPDCGMDYESFRRGGRLGCGRDYDVFAGPLTGLLERIHRRAEHRGKAPRRAGRTPQGRYRDDQPG